MKFSLRLNFRRLVFFILALTLLLSFAGCGQENQPDIESVEDPTIEATEDTNTETYIAATMGTIITDKLHIRKGAGSDYESIDKYSKGDRVEIQETKTVDGTVWGRTGKGWIGMGYVRMDGTPITPSDGETLPYIISDGNTAVLGYGVVNLNSLNVRTGPETDENKVTEISRGVRYAYYEISGDWVRIESGWVSTEYFYVEGTVTDTAMTGIVTTKELNIRTGPHTDFMKTAVYTDGEIIEILAQVNGWAYTEQGWVNMTYVIEKEPVYTAGTATVLRGLNIRAEASADSEKVDEYREGDQISILEVDGHWGKTEKGWINLKYVKYDQVPESTESVG